MNIIFPADPMNRKKPDEAFEREVEAAESVGFEVGFLGPEVHFGEIPNIYQKYSTGILFIYRGWMLSIDEYTKLFKAYRLYTNPEAYRHSYHFPEWYKAVGKAHTPKSVWHDGGTDGVFSGIIDNIITLVKTSGFKQAIIKDFVKSQKHDWYDACFIRDAEDADEIKRVTSNFIRASYGLVGGLVFREYIPLKQIGIHPKSKLPLANEHRMFIINGKVIFQFPYWTEGNYDGDKPDANVIAPWVSSVKSPFFAADVAQKEDGSWILIEINDGGTAGLPDNVDAVEFYKVLKANI